MNPRWTGNITKPEQNKPVCISNEIYIDCAYLDMQPYDPRLLSVAPFTNMV